MKLPLRSCPWLVVDELLVERAADPLHHAADDLAVGDRGIDHAAAVVGDGVAQQLDHAGGHIHSHHRHVHACGVRDRARAVDGVGGQVRGLRGRARWIERRKEARLRRRAAASCPGCRCGVKTPSASSRSSGEISSMSAAMRVARSRTSARCLRDRVAGEHERAARDRAEAAARARPSRRRAPPRPRTARRGRRPRSERAWCGGPGPATRRRSAPPRGRPAPRSRARSRTGPTPVPSV